MKEVLLIIKSCRGFEAGWMSRTNRWVFSLISMKASEKNQVKPCCVSIATLASVPLEDPTSHFNRGISSAYRPPQNIGTRIPRIRAVTPPRAI